MHITNARPRHSVLAAALLSALTLSTGLTHAATWPVTSCNDSGSGTLRAVINNASTKSGDTVDLSKLTAKDVGCSASTISLVTGALTVKQDDLYIVGPSAGITITGKSNDMIELDRIFTHSGTGTLALNYVNVAYGAYYASAQYGAGGCIFSEGNVYLSHGSVSHCTVDASIENEALGGGIVTVGNLTVRSSTLTNNVAGKKAGAGDYGGALAVGNLTMILSSVEHNSTNGVNGGLVGGLGVQGGASISESTIANNTSQLEIGGLFIIGTTTITNSTISGNVTKKGSIGGILSEGQVTIRNSTIAFNTAATSTYGAAGFVERPYHSSVTVNLQSSLISNNTYGDPPTDADVSLELSGSGTATLSGANNLVFASSADLPAGTITGKCPLLGSLRNNGGPTLTHALLSGSPAIGKGNNSQSLPDDQRGAPFVRLSGNKTDVGAYEVQQDDIIFNTDFETCS